MRGVYNQITAIEETNKKHHSTPGFFAFAVRKALHQARPGRHDEPEEDWGGFQDVGKHTNCLLPDTAWPLVTAVLRHLAGPVRTPIRRGRWRRRCCATSLCGCGA